MKLNDLLEDQSLADGFNKELAAGFSKAQYNQLEKLVNNCFTERVYIDMIKEQSGNYVAAFSTDTTPKKQGRIFFSCRLVGSKIEDFSVSNATGQVRVKSQDIFKD